MTTIVPCDFDGMPAWKFSTPSGATAVVAARGATLLSWQPRAGEEIIDGYADAEELREARGGRSMVMAPWCGSIEDGSYHFADRKYILAGSDDVETFGGRVSSCDFRRVHAESSLMLVGILEADEGFPWQIEVLVTYGLDTGAHGEEHLSVSIQVENLSSSTAPVSIGWHPFIKMPGTEGISNLSLTIPARTKVVADKRAVPRVGEAAFAGVAAPERFDYLGNQTLDMAFIDLVPNEEGVVVTEVTEPLSGTRLLMTQEPSEAPVLLVYTGDELQRGARGSLAISPCSALSNAVNRADSRARLPLEPGGIRTLTTTLSYLA